MMKKNSVFYLSDGTGITASTLGKSLLTQFEQIYLEEITIPYVDTLEKAQKTCQQIEEAYRETGKRPLVFCTFVNPELNEVIQKSSALVLDFFKTFIGPLEAHFEKESTHTAGRTHGMRNDEEYMVRMNAVNYTLNNDDGANIHDYGQADIILLGVSRCGKTPTSLYLALHFGLYVANFPLTEENLERESLPEFLKPFKNKIFALTIEADRLEKIRQERRPNSKYASSKTCISEILQAEKIFQKEKLPYISTTTRSIEEISTEIMTKMNIKKRIY